MANRPEDGIRDGVGRKNANQILIGLQASDRNGKQAVTVNRRVDGTDRAGEPVMSHTGDLAERSLAKRGIRDDHTDRGVAGKLVLNNRVAAAHVFHGAAQAGLLLVLYLFNL